MSHNPIQGDAPGPSHLHAAPTKEALDDLRALATLYDTFYFAFDEINRYSIRGGPAQRGAFPSVRTQKDAEEGNDYAVFLFKTLWQLRSALGRFEIPKSLQRCLADHFSLSGCADQDNLDARAKAIFNLSCKINNWVLASLELIEEAKDLDTAIAVGRVKESDLVRQVTHLEARFEGLVDA